MFVFKGGLRKSRAARLRFQIAASALAILAFSGKGLADFTLNDAITTLQIYNDGGDDLIAEVSLDVISDRSAVGAYCLAAGSAPIKQKTAIVHGIMIALAGVTGRSADNIAGLVRQCCPIFAAASIDQRIAYGSKLALEARRAYRSDQRASSRFTALVGSCSDEVLDRSFALALGNDRIGLFIAQDDRSSPAQFSTATGPSGAELEEDW